MYVGPEVELGGLYDPALLPDFDPTIFGLTAAKLAQQDILGVDGKLIAPWDMAEKLRPGTLVGVEANLIMYTFCKPSDPSTVRISFRSHDQTCSHGNAPEFSGASPPCSGARRVSSPCHHSCTLCACVPCQEICQWTFRSSLQVCAPHHTPQWRLQSG